jgi:hypothetical protein
MILGDLGGGLSGGLLSQSFDLGAQAVAAPGALLLGVGALVGGFHGVERFCKPRLTIVAALNDMLRNAREIQAGKPCHDLSRVEHGESVLDRSHRRQRSSAH